MLGLSFYLAEYVQHTPLFHLNNIFPVPSNTSVSWVDPHTMIKSLHFTLYQRPDNKLTKQTWDSVSHSPKANTQLSSQWPSLSDLSHCQLANQLKTVIFQMTCITMPIVYYCSGTEKYVMNRNDKKLTASLCMPWFCLIPLHYCSNGNTLVTYTLPLLVSGTFYWLITKSDQAILMVLL